MADDLQNQNDLTAAEAAFWREREAGRTQRDRGGYYAHGFRDGYEVATADQANVVTAAHAAHQAAMRLAEHLASEAIGGRCAVVDGDGVDPEGRCVDEAVAVRWEDGFADPVCERHAENARDRGALVAYPRRHDGTHRPAQDEARAEPQTGVTTPEEAR